MDVFIPEKLPEMVFCVEKLWWISSSSTEYSWLALDFTICSDAASGGMIKKSTEDDQIQPWTKS